MKRKKAFCKNIDLAGWQLDGVDDALDKIADALKPAILEAAGEAISYAFDDGEEYMWLGMEGGKPLGLYINWGSSKHDTVWLTSLDDLIDFNFQMIDDYSSDGEDVSKEIDNLRATAQAMRELADSIDSRLDWRKG